MPVPLATSVRLTRTAAVWFAFYAISPARIGLRRASADANTEATDSPPTQTALIPTPVPAPTSTTPGSQDTPEQLSFLALGDSYTIGESVAVEDRWPVQLARRLQEEGIDIAEPGDHRSDRLDHRPAVGGNRYRQAQPDLTVLSRF